METQDVTIESLDLPTEIKTRWQSAFEQCWQTQRVVKFDYSLERSGSRYLQVTVNPIKTESEAVPCCCYVAKDLTDLRETRTHLMLMNAAVENIQESVVITTPNLNLDRLLESSRQASKEVRDLSHRLHPVNIEKSGLMTALQHLSTITKEVFNVHCEFTYEQPILIDDRTTATHLYRIVQEAVNNAVRHGKATQILIGLARFEVNKHTLTVSDNGIGISNEVLQNQGKGMGLNSMRYRAEFIEAEFKIERGEDSGTIVSCIFDYKNISSKIDSPYRNNSSLSQ